MCCGVLSHGWERGPCLMPVSAFSEPGRMIHGVISRHQEHSWGKQITLPWVLPDLLPTSYIPGQHLESPYSGGAVTFGKALNKVELPGPLCHLEWAGSATPPCQVL